MQNPKYLVNIVFIPSEPNGQQLIFLNGATQSVRTYSNEFFVASMPEVKISATGSSYTEALSKLLLIATSSTPENGLGPINNTSLL